MATQMPPTTPQPGAPPVAARTAPEAPGDPSNVKILAAEIVGTTVLMMGGPGSAILAGNEIGILGVSLAFGLSLLVMAYVLGHVSGCHINPAVTAGMAIARKIPVVSVPFYVVGQLVGAALGGFVIWVIASGLDGFTPPTTSPRTAGASSARPRSQAWAATASDPWSSWRSSSPPPGLRGAVDHPRQVPARRRRHRRPASPWRSSTW